MKGILKLYHPEETLRYNIQNSYCKAVYLNAQNFLEVEIITDDDLDEVDDDSLRYNFPQIALRISDFPIDWDELPGKTFHVDDSDEMLYTEVELYNDETAYISDNELVFTKNARGDTELVWKGLIDDFCTNTTQQIPFKLKCHFRQEEMDAEDLG